MHFPGLPIAHIVPFTLSDFPRTPAAIFFVQGCNLKCPYCHNKQLWSLSRKGVSIETVSTFLKTSQLPGIVVTGGEPTIYEDLPIFLQTLRESGVVLKLDTNGTRPEMIKEVLPLLDFIAMDVKAPLEHYDTVAGVSMDWSCIEKSISLIRDSGVDHLFRTTVDLDLLRKDEYDAVPTLLPPSSPHIFQIKQ